MTALTTGISRPITAQLAASGAQARQTSATLTGGPAMGGVVAVWGWAAPGDGDTARLYRPRGRAGARRLTAGQRGENTQAGRPSRMQARWSRSEPSRVRSTAVS